MKTLKKLSICLVVVVLLTGLTAFSGCGNIVTGSGETTTLELAHSNFTRVEINTGFNMDITKADEFYISITIDNHYTNI